MTKKEHYVPQFYLRGFTNEKGYIAVFDTKDKKYFNARPEDICHIKYLYETKNESNAGLFGEYICLNDIEQLFSKKEKDYAALLNTVQIRCKKGNIDSLILSSQETDMLAELIANLMVRNPANFESVGMNQIDESMKQKVTEYLKDLFDGTDIAANYDISNEICSAAHKKALLSNEIKGSLPNIIAKELLNMDFSFYIADSHIFLSCDNPVIAGKDPFSISNDKTCVYLALTPKISVLFGKYSYSRKMRNRLVCLNDNEIERFNNLLIRSKNYGRFIFASNNKELENFIRQSNMF